MPAVRSKFFDLLCLFELIYLLLVGSFVVSSSLKTGNNLALEPLTQDP